MIPQAMNPLMENATLATHIPASVAPYIPSQEILISALEDNLACVALYLAQGRQPQDFGKAFFECQNRFQLARLHARDAKGEIVWVHPKLLSSMLHMCSRSDQTAQVFIERLSEGKLQNVFEQRLLKFLQETNVLEGVRAALVEYLERVPSILVQSLKRYTQAERFRLEVEELPSASMTTNVASQKLAALASEYGLDWTAAATLSAIGRGVLPVRQSQREVTAEARFIYALATLVDTKNLARPSAENVGFALSALKTERICRLVGMEPTLPLCPVDTLVAELAWAFRSIDTGKSALKSRMAQIEIVDARYTHISDMRALTLLFENKAATENIPDDRLAEVLMALIGTSAFLRSKLPYSELSALMAIAQRLLSERGIDTRITAERCRLQAVGTVKHKWLTKVGAVRRVRRYGQHAVKRCA